MMQRRHFMRAMIGLSSGVLLPINHAQARRTYPPVPAGYARVAQRVGVPALILYGIALQESVLVRGKRALPYPWVLNIRKSPRFYDSYHEAVAGLKTALARGVKNVDCGLMQVNWGYHAEKLGTPAQALDPYPNLLAGASILRHEYLVTKDWFMAVGRYHSPGDKNRAQDYARKVYQRIAQVRNA